MTRRGPLWVGLAVVLAVASIFSALAGRGSDSARILVATEALAAGEDLETAVLEDRARLRDVGGAEVLAGVIDDVRDLSGARLAAPVQVGEPITHAALGGHGQTLPEVGPSERLISIPLAAVGAVAAAVGPGAEVDVVSSASEGPIAAARVIAERVVVVVVEDGVDAIERGAGGVVIRVSDTEALVVTEALATGRDLRLIVRPSTGTRP